MPDSNFDVVKAGAKEVITLLSADGAIPVRAGTYHITKGSAAALTLAAPTTADEGAMIIICSETAFVHTVVNSSPGFNNLGANGDTVTFDATVGSRITLRARNGIWWIASALNALIAVDVVKARFKEVITLLSADGAIPVRAGTYHITKGSACILTLAAPSAADEGAIINILSETAFAHTITNSAPGFNNLGAAGDVATFSAAAANRLCVRARNGIWWVIDNLNATIA